MSHTLLCPCPLATLVQFAKGNFPLPLPQVNTLSKVLGVLKGAATAVCLSMYISQS